MAVPAREDVEQSDFIHWLRDTFGVSSTSLIAIQVRSVLPWRAISLPRRRIYLRCRRLNWGAVTQRRLHPSFVLDVRGSRGCSTVAGTCRPAMCPPIGFWECGAVCTSAICSRAACLPSSAPRAWSYCTGVAWGACRNPRGLPSTRARVNCCMAGSNARGTLCAH